jgi:hypothetical protein
MSGITPLSASHEVTATSKGDLTMKEHRYPASAASVRLRSREAFGRHDDARMQRSPVGGEQRPLLLTIAEARAVTAQILRSCRVLG